VPSSGHGVQGLGGEVHLIMAGICLIPVEGMRNLGKRKRAGTIHFDISAEKQLKTLSGKFETRRHCRTDCSYRLRSRLALPGCTRGIGGVLHRLSIDQ